VARFKSWDIYEKRELNFYPPATGKSKKRKKRIALLLTQRETLWLLMEDLQYVGNCELTLNREFTVISWRLWQVSNLGTSIKSELESLRKGKKEFQYC